MITLRYLLVDSHLLCFPFQKEFEDAKHLLHTSLSGFPDLYLIFLTNDRIHFEEMIPTQTIANTGQYIIIESNSVDIASFDERLKDEIHKIPKRIISPSCRTEPNQFTRIGIR